MKDFLVFLISQIVDTPEELSVEEMQMGESSFQYMIHANKEDIGKIIGKEGKIIQSIRNVAKVIAIKENKQIRIEIA